jgi:hypothetical protein
MNSDLIIRKYKFHVILYPYNLRINAYRPYKDVEDFMLDTLDYLEV